MQFKLSTAAARIVSRMQGCCMQARTTSPWAKGWSLQSPNHSASLNALNGTRFKKDFLDLCIHACLHVGHMWICAEIRLRQYSPHCLFLHVCSTCCSHISPNIYTACKTLLISLPCLLSCSFSSLTLTLTLFHHNLEWQEGGNKRARGQKESKWAWSEVRRRGKSARRKPVWMREKWVFSVMDDLSSCRNQKPNLPSPVLAKAHSAVMQGGPLG